MTNPTDKQLAYINSLRHKLTNSARLAHVTEELDGRSQRRHLIASDYAEWITANVTVASLDDAERALDSNPWMMPAARAYMGQWYDANPDATPGDGEAVAALNSAKARWVEALTADPQTVSEASELIDTLKGL